MPIASLIIKLRDDASRGIGKIGSALSGLAGKASQAASGTSGLAGAITQGVLQANAITFAIGKATEAIGFLNNKFEEAKNLQLEQINAATTFSALTGQSSEQAAKFIENLNNRLAKSASTLPGVTKDYQALAIAVQDNVLEAFKDPSGKLNQKGFEDALASMSESFGALTAASTRDIGNTSLGLSKALAGASVSELRQIAFFEQNPVILNEIEKRLSSMGKELKDLNIKERVQLLEETGKKFITEDFKKQAAESVDGLLQAFNDSLFSPQTGIFGIMRDLDPATEGVQSAFSSMNDALKELIGPEGVFNRLAEILKAAGIELPDPMKALKGAIDFAVRGLRALNEGLQYMKIFIESGHSFVEALLNLPSFFSTPTKPGETKAKPAGLQKVLLNISPELVLAAAGAVGTIALLNTGFLGAATSAGTFVFSIGGRAITALRIFGLNIILTTYQLTSFARSAYASAGANLRLIASLPGQALSAARLGMQQLASSAVSLLAAMRGLTLGSVLGAVRVGLLSVAGAIRTVSAAALFSPLGVAIGAIALAALLIYKYWDPLKNFFSGFFSGLMQGLSPVMPALQGFGSALMSVVGPALQLVGALFGPIISAIGSLFQPVKDADGSWRSFGETLGKSVAGAIVGTINLVTKLIDIVGDGIDGIKNLVNTAQRLPVIGALLPGDASPAPMSFGSRYDGHIGNAAGGFMSGLMAAAQREMANMPAGAELLVANSSETIIPQGALGQVLSALSPVALPTPVVGAAPGGGGGGNSFNISVVVNEAGSNAAEIADRVVAEIQRKFEGELNAILA